MKKYVMLIAFTVAAIAWIMVLPLLSMIFWHDATGIRVTATRLATSADCSGTIIATKQQIVDYGYSVKPGQVYVKVGDSVTSGQKLMDINKTETVAAMSSLNASSSVGSAATDSTDSSTADTANGTDLSQYAQYYDVAQAGESSDSLQNSSAAETDESDPSAFSDQIPDSTTANISGTVTQLNVESGNFTQAQVPLIVIADFSSLQIKAQVDESMISQVHVGQSVQISGDALSKNYSGKVAQIYPTATTISTDSGKKTIVYVLISILNADGALKPGYSTNVTINTAVNNNAIILPYEAIEEDNSNQKYVYIYQNDRAVRKNIETGTETASSVQIVRGIEAGDIVLKNPASIQGNCKIRLKSILKNT